MAAPTSPSKSIPVVLTRLQDNFTCPTNPDDQVAVIYQDESCRRTFNYSSVVQLSDAIFESINSIVKSDDAEGGAGVEFIGVGCAQNVYYPSVLMGILRSGHAFYCMDMGTQFQHQIRPIQILDISYMLVDSNWMDLNFPKENEEVKLEVVWSMALIPDTHTSLDMPQNNHVDADRSDQRKLYILKVSSRAPESDSSSSKSGGGGGVFITNTTNAKYGLGKDSNWAYAIRTSGTTGTRKLVLVPHACICPNLNSLQQEFQLSSSDVVFGCSPQTFDPSIIDLFLALRNSATILYVSAAIKLNPAKLADVLHSNQVSFMQITPSIYYRFNLEEKAKLFCAAESHVKHIVFGGEKLVDERELRFLLASNRCNIYNIYGTTEVSCWASIAKVDESNVSKVPIGKPLDETELKLFNTQMEPEIAIGSKTRITTVLRECSGQLLKPTVYDGCTYRLTGDSGLYLQNGAGILYNGRFDRVVKRNGYFNDLVFIEDQLMRTGRFSFLHALQYMGKIYVLYKSCVPRTSIETNTLLNDTGGGDVTRTTCSTTLELFNSFPFHSYPDRFIELDRTEVIPISENGKLDESFLRKIVLREEFSPHQKKETITIQYDPDEIEGMLINFWNRCTYGGAGKLEKNGQCQPSPPSDSNLFFEVGGNSMRAVMFVELVMQMCSLRGSAEALKQEKDLLGVLHRESFGTVKQYIYEQICKTHPYTIEQFTLKNVSKEERQANSQDSIETWLEPRSPSTSNIKNVTVKRLRNGWGVSLFGCVDTSATLFETDTPLPGTATPGTKSTLAVIGAHSGLVVTLNLNPILNGADPQIIWTKLFPDRIAASISTSPDQKYIFIPCCDCVIYCACSTTGRIKWIHKGSAMFKATPVPMPVHPPRLLVVSDDAVLTCLDMQTGEVHWSIQPSCRITTTMKPLFIDNEIITIADGAVLLKIDAVTGDVTEFKQETSSCCTDLVHFTTTRGSLLMYGTVFGGIIVLKKDLSKLWMNSCGPPAPVNTPVFHSCDQHEPMITYTTHKGRFVCMDLRGAPILSIQLDSNIHTAPIFYSHVNNKSNTTCLATVIEMDSTITLIDTKEEKLFRKIQNDVVAECFSNPVLWSGNHLIWGSRDNYFHISELQA